MRLTHDTMRAWALNARLLTTLGIPTDLDAVADELGIVIVDSDDLPENVRGMHVEHDSGQIIIAANSRLSFGARRFVLAHEMCHQLINRATTNGGGHTRALPEHRIDRLCNQFAAELLIPHADLELHAPHFAYGLNEYGLDELSNLFEVTAAAMRLRLQELRIPAWWWDSQNEVRVLMTQE